MHTNSGQLTRRGALALLALWASAAIAPALADEGDPPGRVARLSDVEGAVSLEPAGMEQWTAATLNRPLTTGDRLWADRDSRAELDLGDAVIRLGNNTAFAFLNLDDANAQLQVTAGTLLVRVRELAPNQSYEIDTPNLALLLQQPGAYRVEVSEAGDTTLVKVSEGAAQAAGVTQTVAIGAAQQMRFSGAATLAYDSATLGPADGLDNWAASRDGQFDNSTSAEYIADDIPGTQDLDDNGRWQDTPEYGYVWVPTAVVAGWVPYRFGHWVWITPWGWTWLDDAHWGYAPFHYGRWAEWRNSWCWMPGPPQLRPVYAPALVAWVGGSAAATPAPRRSLGWFPLGPREVYVPAYPASTAYTRNVNITDTTIVDSAVIAGAAQTGAATPTHYVNNRPDVVTVVPQEILTSGQRVGAHAEHLSAAALAKIPVSSAPLSLPPIRQSVLGPDEGRSAVRPPAALLQRRVLAHTPPPRAPAPFEKQLAAMQENGGRPLASGELARLQPATPAVPVKVIAASGLVVGATPVPRHNRGGHPLPATGAGASGTASLVDRERQLQNATLPPAPRAKSVTSPTAHANVSPSAASAEPAQSTPGVRTDRPPWAQQSQLAAPAPPAPDEPTRESRPPSSAPVSQPASSSTAAAHPQQPARAVETHSPSSAAKSTPAAPPAHPPAQPAHPPTQTAQPPAPPPKQASSDPRDEAPHGDRDSRERVTR
jgi:FecR protein